MSASCTDARTGAPLLSSTPCKDADEDSFQKTKRDLSLTRCRGPPLCTNGALSDECFKLGNYKTARFIGGAPKDSSIPTTLLKSSARIASPLQSAETTSSNFTKRCLFLYKMLWTL